MVRPLLFLVAAALAGCTAPAYRCGHPVPCARGSVQSCTSRDGARCRYLVSDGTPVECASCDDCFAAEREIAAWCASDGAGVGGGASAPDLATSAPGDMAMGGDLDVGPAPADLAHAPHDLAKPPVDLAWSPRDLATAPVDLATAPVDLATRPVDLATKATDLSTSPEDLATTPDDLASSPSDMCLPPLFPCGSDPFCCSQCCSGGCTLQGLCALF